MSYSICCDSWHQRLTYHIRLLVGTTPMWLFSNNWWIDLNVFNIPENYYFEFIDIISDASFYFSHTLHIFSDYMACFTLTLAAFLVHCWLQMIINPIFLAACRIWIHEYIFFESSLLIFLKNLHLKCGIISWKLYLLSWPSVSTAEDHKLFYSVKPYHN